MEKSEYGKPNYNGFGESLKHPMKTTMTNPSTILP